MTRAESASETRAADGDVQLRRAMYLSLGVGLLMLLTKVIAYALTGSAAILADAAESVVHVVAVAFAAYSLSLSRRPADPCHPYGHERIVFFSAGVEGTLIVFAAGYILFEAVQKWLTGLELERLGTGTALVGAAYLTNGALGAYLIWQGRRHRSLILEANGKHVLTDSWTSLGVIIGLGLVGLTGWRPFDPILAILVAANILWSGGRLIRRSVGGLMDEADPETERVLRGVLGRLTAEGGMTYHGLKHRNTGQTLWVEFHLLFPAGTPIESAHARATHLEREVKQALPLPTEVISHLESVEDHAQAHEVPHSPGSRP